MLSKAGIEKIRDLIYNELGTGYFGDDGTQVSEADTDLGNVVSGTDASLDLSKFNKGILAEHTLVSSAGNTNILREFAIKTSDGTLLNRAVFPAIDKDATVELNTSVQILFFQSEDI